MPAMKGLELLRSLQEAPARPTNKQRTAALERLGAATAAHLAGTPHPDIDLDFDELLEDEMSRKTLPNRAAARAVGLYGRHAKRWHLTARMGRDNAKLDAVEDNPQRTLQRNARRLAALERASRVSARIAERRERLGL